MKISITISASIPDEAGYDSVSVVSEVIGRSLKGNEVITVHEIAVLEEEDDA